MALKQTKRKNERRVVVTGIGVVSSIGIGWQEFWKNLIAGKSGISKIESFDTSEYDRHYGGEVKNFDPTKYIDRRKIPYLGRASQFAIAASKMALEDAGLKIEDLPRDRMGVCIGTTMGESQVIESIIKKITQLNQIHTSEIDALSYPASNISANVANYFKIKGENFLFANACAAGNFAIGYGYDLIQSNKADFVLAGGSDVLSRIAFTGFSRLYAMAPEKCQPFDKNRKGMMLSEGAGIVLLEPLEVARGRKADIYAEILGYGLSCDARHMTNPLEKGIERAIRKAIINSQIHLSCIDYINAHGTGTVENDRAECKVLTNIFARYLKKIPISSSKSMLGHTMGAASAIETIICCLAICKKVIPPTINLKEKDPICDIDCVPNKMRHLNIDISMNNSSAFGGNNACMIYKRIDNS